jgi:hypothetical protein
MVPLAPDTQRLARERDTSRSVLTKALEQKDSQDIQVVPRRFVLRFSLAPAGTNTPGSLTAFGRSKFVDHSATLLSSTSMGIDELWKVFNYPCALAIHTYLRLRN